MLFLLVALLVSLTGYYVEAEDSYRAPFYDRGGSKKVANSFIVMFNRGHTISKHWKTIGKDYSSSPDFYHWKYFFAYTAELVGAF